LPARFARPQPSAAFIAERVESMFLKRADRLQRCIDFGIGAASIGIDAPRAVGAHPVRSRSWAAYQVL
jgi:hypothetical protein